jgi:DNA-binding protein HU-beta
MNGRANLDKTVAKTLGCSNLRAHDAIDAVLGAITAAVAAGAEVRLPGFGIFAPVTRAARNGRNPQTGAALAIAEKRAVKFRAGRRFKNAVAAAPSGRNAAAAD